MYTLLANTINSIQVASGPSIVTTNLVIHYDFTNPACYPGSGTIAQNLALTNYDLNFVNLPTWNGSYFTFDGVNDYGTIATIGSVNTQGSVGYWFKLTDSLVTLLNQRISGINGNWEFGRLDNAGSSVGSQTSCPPTNYVLPNGTITADLGASNSTWTVGYSFTNTTWAYYVMTWSVGGTAKTYVNGSLVHSCFPGTNSRTGTWTVGRSPGNTTRYFKGNLGWMTYYDRQLSDAEVLQNFNATKSDYGY